MIVIVKCSYCEEEKEINSNRLKRSKDFFCNTKHQLLWQRRNRKFIICEYCSKKLSRVSAKVRKHNFCNREHSELWHTGVNNCMYGKNKGVDNAFYGRHHTKESIRKIVNNRDTRGEKHWNWQGGKSLEGYTINWTQTLKRAIRERDKFTCQICGKQQGGTTFQVHHIDYNKKNCNPENLVTLCTSCHVKTNFNRERWIKHFQTMSLL